MDKLTQSEAEHLIEMLKQTLVAAISLPEQAKATAFDAKGETISDLFTIKIYRGKINKEKYEIGARVKYKGILLLELHINPGNVHINPDGTKILGSHWHIYTEEYGLKMAYPAEDLNSNSFIENTILFFNRFNLIEQPEVLYQTELQL